MLKAEVGVVIRQSMYPFLPIGCDPSNKLIYQVLWMIDTNPSAASKGRESGGQRFSFLAKVPESTPNKNKGSPGVLLKVFSIKMEPVAMLPPFLILNKTIEIVSTPTNPVST
jgi:hypothetical protein